MNNMTKATGSAAQPALVELGRPDHKLTIEDIFHIARGSAQATIYSPAYPKLERCHQVVMQALRNGQPVYGLTAGVGLNKDRLLFSHESQHIDSLLKASRQHNLTSLKAHAAGTGQAFSPELVRAAMLVRTNVLLTGAAGVQPAVVEQLKNFLRLGITPVVPSKGSIGMADVTQNAHIGLALIGEWDVFYGGRRIPAKQALENAGLKPVRLVGKDFLAIISSNCLTVARLSLAFHEVKLLLDRLQLLFALALEGFNANLAPFLDSVTSAMPGSGMRTVAKNLCNILAGSSLWLPDSRRLLQDPLCIRGMAYTLGQAYECLQQSSATLVLHINHSDDNPFVTDEVAEQGSALDKLYQVRDEAGKSIGAIYPSANYDGQNLAITAEKLSISLARLSNSIAMQIIRTELPNFTGLSRFLSYSENKGHAFGALQKPILALDRENQSLTVPVSTGQSVMAGGIEDVGTFGMLAIENLERIIDNIYEMASLHLLHFTQAVDLRIGFKQAPITARLHEDYRKAVPFVTEDRVFTPDIIAGKGCLQNLKPEDYFSSIDSSAGRYRT